MPHGRGTVDPHDLPEQPSTPTAGAPRARARGPGMLVPVCRLAFPQGIAGRERPLRRVGWKCTSQPFPMPRQASKKGGRSDHGLRFRRGAAAPEAVVQPKSVQRHAKSRTCTSESRFSAHAPRIHMCASESASGPRHTARSSPAPSVTARTPQPILHLAERRRRPPLGGRPSLAVRNRARTALARRAVHRASPLSCRTAWTR